MKMEDVVSKLNDYTEPLKLFKIGVGNKVFHGQVHQDHFKIYRQISYRNSFLPQIKGRMTQKENKTIIDVSMKLHPFVIAFMTLWFSGLISACMSFFLSPWKPFFFVPIIMLIFGILLCTLPFWYEVKKSKNELFKIFSVYMSSESDGNAQN
ncbi:hypothetical protein [Oceanispirochaeta crateris]|uniref:hypothetical protein n=1 Tax=Oceanispirochaeta crateris TaxID=2518645 RepID=UPI001AEF5F6C|nr:hypothetical protein [Oceanispirochaeta crateris]